MFQRICFPVRRAFVAGLIVAMASASGFAQAPARKTTTFQGFIARDYISGYYLLENGNKRLVNEVGPVGSIRVTNVTTMVNGMLVSNGPMTLDGFFGGYCQGGPPAGVPGVVVVTVQAEYSSPGTFVRDESAPGGLRLVEPGQKYPFGYSYTWNIAKLPGGTSLKIKMDDPGMTNPKVTSLSCSLPPAVVSGGGAKGNLTVTGTLP